MHQIPLFLDPTISLEKVATSSKLEGDADKWPIEILKVAFKSLPSLRSYEADVELDRVDGARGFAVGKLLVYPTGLTKEAASGTDKLVTLPVIVRESELYPFDVYAYKGSMYAMDESDVLEIMSRPETFSSVADRDQFTGTNLFGQLVPPNTDHQYNAGSLMKHGSVRSLSMELATSQGVESTLGLLKRDVGLRSAFLTDDYLRGYVDEVLNAQKTASIRPMDKIELKPSVVQFGYDSGKFTVKTANHMHWQPKSEVVSRFWVQEQLQPAAFNKLMDQGFVTLAADPVSSTVVSEKIASETGKLGIYRVWSGGKSLDGIVIPRVVDLEGTDLGLQIFANGSSHAMQEKIAGVHRFDVTLEDVEPRGLGVFVYQEGVHAFATEPVRVLNQVGGDSYFCKKASTGEEVVLTKSAGLWEVLPTRSGYAIPASMKFVPLGNSSFKISNEEAANYWEVQKVASEGTRISFSDEMYFIDAAPFSSGGLTAEDAEFALGGLGIPTAKIPGILKQAQANPVRLSNVRPVLDAHGSVVSMHKEASINSGKREAQRFGVEVDAEKLLKSVAGLVSPGAQDLWKEAGVNIPKETVDAILSLNFMTPENASAYLSYLPLLEKTSSILAELLVASRLGMDDVREASALNAMTQVNAVVRGLSKLGEKVR
jgi:hypothetical protein